MDALARSSSSRRLLAALLVAVFTIAGTTLVAQPAEAHGICSLYVHPPTQSGSSIYSYAVYTCSTNHATLQACVTLERTGVQPATASACSTANSTTSSGVAFVSLSCQTGVYTATGTGTGTNQSGIEAHAEAGTGFPPAVCL